MVVARERGRERKTEGRGKKRQKEKEGNEYCPIRIPIALTGIESITNYSVYSQRSLTGDARANENKSKTRGAKTPNAVIVPFV